MDKDFGINSKVDLYKRLTPALNCKKRELQRITIKQIKKEDIWNYLIKTRWENVSGLNLSDMVDDILNLDNNDLIKFLEKKEDSFETENIVKEEIELL